MFAEHFTYPALYLLILFIGISAIEYFTRPLISDECVHDRPWRECPECYDQWSKQ